MVTSYVYHSIRDAAARMCSLVPSCECVIVDLPFPVQSAEHVVCAFAATITRLKHKFIMGSRVLLAIVERITSKPSVILPLEQMLELLAEHCIPVCVDGAHAVGQVTFNGDAAAAVMP
jgi:hypothetical protein